MAFHHRHMITGTERTDNEHIDYENGSIIFMALRSLWSRLDVNDIEKITLKQIVRTYHGRLRRKYEIGYKNLKDHGILPKHFVNRCFIKDDKYCVKSYEIADPKMPRAIQYQSPESVLTKGKMLIPIEKQFYKMLDYHGLRIFTKGLNSKDLGDLFVKSRDSIPNCIFVENDFSAYDASVSIALLKIYEKFVRKYIPKQKRKFFKYCMRFGYRPRGWTSSGIPYKVTGTITSGDIDTSFKGNFINYFVVLCIMMESQIPDKEYKIIVNGDDSVMFLNNKYLDKYRGDLFAQFGLNAKIIVKTEFQDVEFCQSTPFVCGDSVFMVRDPQRMFTRLGWVTRRFSKKNARDYVKTVVMGEMALNFGVPVLYTWLRDIYHKLPGKMNTSLLDGFLVSQYGLDKPWAYDHNFHFTNQEKDAFQQQYDFQLACKNFAKPPNHMRDQFSYEQTLLCLVK